MTTSSSEWDILDAWQANAQAWQRAVRERGIESRRLVTDQAIVEAVMSRSPRKVIDLGCGEGWLARVLAGKGVQVTGVDVVPVLIEAAREQGGGAFHLLSYADLAAGALNERADAVVCNFSLLGEASVDHLLAAIPRLLEPEGVLLVQTLHPLAVASAEPYRDGWRDGSWAGCGEGFGKPAPWYFRTLGGWLACFQAAGLQLIQIDEPLHPYTGRPASVIFTAGAR